MADDLSIPGLPNITDAIVGAPSVSGGQAIATDAMDILDNTILKRQVDTINSSTQSLVMQAGISQDLYKQSQATQQSIKSALAKKAEIDSMPRVVANIMGLFNKDYSRRAVESDIVRNQMELQGIGQQLDNIQQLGLIQGKVVENQIKASELMYNTQAAQVNRALELRKTMFNEEISLEEQQRQRAQERRAQNQENRTQILFKQQQTQHQLGIMDDAVLAAAMKGEVAGITPFQAKEESIRRQKDELDLQNIQNAVESGNMELANRRKAEFLNNQNGVTLSALAEKATEEGGSVEYNGITFSLRELERATAVVAGEEKGYLQAATKTEIDKEMTVWNLENVEMKVAGVTTALGGQVNASRFNALMDQAVRQAKVYGKNGDWESAHKAMAAVNTAVDKAIEDALKAFPEEQRDFVNAKVQQMEPSNKAAQNYLGVEMLNSNLLGAVDAQGNLLDPYSSFTSVDAKYVGPFNVWRSQLQKVVTDSGAKTNPDGSIDIASLLQSMGSDKSKFPQMVASTLSEARTPDGRTAFQVFAAERDNNAVWDAVQDMQKTMPRVFSDISPTMFITKNEAGAEVFDASPMLLKLRDKWEADKQIMQQQMQANPQNPAMAIPAPYDVQFLDYMSSAQFQQRINNNWMAGLGTSGAAVAQLLHNNNPLAGYNATVSTMRANFEEYYKRVSEQRRAIADNMQNIKAGAEIASGMVMPFGGTP